MVDMRKLNIQAIGSWLFNITWTDFPRTTKEIAGAIVDCKEGGNIITAIEEAKVAKEQEQFEPLRPTWLIHAPKNTQNYRKQLEDRALKWDQEAIKEMEFFQWKFAYNEDGTVTLLKFEWAKIFCPDLTGNWWRKNWKDAKEFAKSKWYHLLTIWNDSDKQEEKEKTDLWKLRQYFGEYANTWAITYMLGFDEDRYWTGTECGEDEWYFVGIEYAIDIMMHKNGYTRWLDDKIIHRRICGLSNS